MHVLSVPEKCFDEAFDSALNWSHSEGGTKGVRISATALHIGFFHPIGFDLREYLYVQSSLVQFKKKRFGHNALPKLTLNSLLQYAKLVRHRRENLDLVNALHI